MNNPTPAATSPNDLVLQITGGDRDGQLLSVRTAKCLLSSLISNEAEAEKHRCAIFRGSKGVAFRSYNEHVLVNGVKTSVQWLKKGDVIALTAEITVAVKNLGFFDSPEPGSHQPKQGQPAPAQSTPAQPTPAQPKLMEPAMRPVVNTVELSPSALPQNTPPTNTAPVPHAPSSIGGNSETAAALPAPSTVNRAVLPAADLEQNVGERVSTLSNQLSSLVTEASGVTEPPKNADLPEALTPVAEPTPQPDANLVGAEAPLTASSSSIQAFLDKALAAPQVDSSPTTNSPVTPPLTAAPAPLPERPAVTPPAGKTPQQEAVANTLNRLLSKADAPTSQVPHAAAAPLTANAIFDSVVEPPAQHTTESIIVEADAQPNATPQPSPELPPVPATAPVSSTPVVEAESRVQSLNFLKSLGVDAAELGLSSTPAMSNVPAQAVTDQPPVNPQPATNVDDLLASITAVSTKENQPSTDLLSAAEGSPEVQPIDAARSNDAPEGLPKPVAASQKVESVADVLARMQNAGSLASFNMDASEEPAIVSTPEPIAQTAPKPASKPASKPAAASASPPAKSTRPAATGSQTGDDDDGTVEDYMAQLLNRMRGGEADDDQADAKPQAKKKESQITPQKTTVQNTPAPAADAQADALETLTQEEFVPKQKAVRVQSFDSLREIANSSARLAIQDHLANQRQVSTQTKLQLGMISLFFSIVCFAMSFLFSDTIVWSGVMFGFLFLLAGIGLAYLYREESKLDESLVNEQNS